MNGSWSWGWLPSDPPGHFGDNLPFDIVRLVVVLLTIRLAAMCGRVLLEQRRRAVPFQLGQIMRFVSLGMGLVYVSVTELAVFGTAGTPRILIGVAMAATGLQGVASMRREQLSNPVVRR